MQTSLYWIPELRRRQMVAMATIFAQLGMCFCASASVSPWPSMDLPSRTDGEPERAGEACVLQAGDWTGQERV